MNSYQEWCEYQAAMERSLEAERSRAAEAERRSAEEIKAHVESVKALAWYQRRVEMLLREQKRLRDPERNLVCDILANGALLPDPDGKRYGTTNVEVSGGRSTSAGLTGSACHRCGSQLEGGVCTDETCPFSDHVQDCECGWIGHPEHAANEDTPCTCKPNDAAVAHQPPQAAGSDGRP